MKIRFSIVGEYRERYPLASLTLDIKGYPAIFREGETVQMPDGVLLYVRSVTHHPFGEGEREGLTGGWRDPYVYIVLGRERP